MRLRAILLVVALLACVLAAFIDLSRTQGIIRALALVLGAMAVAWVALRRYIREGYREAEREDRRRRGRCLTCGYWLRGNASGVCPECGTPVERE